MSRYLTMFIVASLAGTACSAERPQFGTPSEMDASAGETGASAGRLDDAATRFGDSKAPRNEEAGNKVAEDAGGNSAPLEHNSTPTIIGEAGVVSFVDSVTPDAAATVTLEQPSIQATDGQSSSNEVTSSVESSHAGDTSESASSDTMAPTSDAEVSSTSSSAPTSDIAGSSSSISGSPSSTLEPSTDDSSLGSDSTASSDSSAETLSYATDIRPIFAEKCSVCHMGSWFGDGSSEPDTDLKAEIAERIRTQGPGRMPAQGSLTENEIALIVAWAEQ